MNIEDRKNKPAQQGKTSKQKKVNQQLSDNRPIYQIVKTDESEPEFVLRKLMQRKGPKPQMYLLQKSQILTRIQQIMPIFKQSQLQINQAQRIDVQLQQVEDSSSSEEESDEDEEKQLKKVVEIDEGGQSMQNQSQLAGLEDNDSDNNNNNEEENNDNKMKSQESEDEYNEPTNQLKRLQPCVQIQIVHSKIDVEFPALSLSLALQLNRTLTQKTRDPGNFSRRKLALKDRMTEQ